MQKNSSASSAACVRFVEAVSICLVSWDLFFGASHFCSLKTVDLVTNFESIFVLQSKIKYNVRYILENDNLLLN